MLIHVISSYCRPVQGVAYPRRELFRKTSGVVHPARHAVHFQGAVDAAFVRRVIPRDVSKVLFARANGLGLLSTSSPVLSSPCFRAGTAFDVMIVGILCVSYGMNA